MIFAYIFAFFATFLVSFSSIFFMRKIGPRWGLVDRPGHRKVHETPTPTGGGLGIWFAVILAFAFAHLALFILLQLRGDGDFFAKLPEFLSVHLEGLWMQSGKLWILLGLGTVLVALGTLDDRFNLSWKVRILVQTAVAICAVNCGFRASLFLEAPFFTGFVSVIWIVMLINSFNMLDNMNGLSAGVAMICSGFLAAVMLLNPDPQTNRPQLFLGGFLIVLIGAISGFFMHNNPYRAKIFMGDGGAYFIGFLLATSTLNATFAGYEVARTTIFVPLLILAIPIYDTTSVVLIRFREGRSPFEGDKRHFSHRLTDRGFSKPQAVLIIYFTTTVCAIGSLLLYQVNFFGASLIFLQSLLVLLLIAVLESR